MKTNIGTKVKKGRVAKWLKDMDRKLLVTVSLPPGRNVYESHEQLVDLNEASVISMGYIPCSGWKSPLIGLNTKCYIRFVGFDVMMPKRTRDGKVEEVTLISKDALPLYETATTLYDYFKSDGELSFMRGMGAKKVRNINKKVWVYIIAAVAVVLIGAYIGLR